MNPSRFTIGLSKLAKVFRSRAMLGRGRTVMASGLVIFSAWTAVSARAEGVAGAQNLGTIWFLGDSITRGGSDNDSTRTVRSALYNLLSAKGYAFDFTGHETTNPEGLPQTGETVDDDLYRYHSGVGGAVIARNFPDGSGFTRTGIRENLPRWWKSGRLREERPNLILVMIGTNDVDLNLDLRHAGTRLHNLLHAIYKRPGIGKPTILLASIPPNRRDAATVAAVAEFNARLPKLVKRMRQAGRRIYFVDQFSTLDQDFDSLMIGPTNLHPNGQGDAAIARNWFEVIDGMANQSAPER